MIIILCLYVVALWLVFSKFKLVRWGWLSGTVSRCWWIYPRDISRQLGIVGDDDSTGDGYVTLVTVTVGDRALQMHSAVSSSLRTRSRWSACFRRTAFRPSSKAHPSISFSTMPRGGYPTG